MTRGISRAKKTLRFCEAIAWLSVALVSAPGWTQVAEGPTSQAALPRQVAGALRNRYPQRKLATCDGNSQRKAALGRHVLKVSGDGEVRIEGVDRAGRPWSAVFSTAPVAQCDVFQADMAGDGREDIIVLSFGTNSSGGWDTTLSLLLFDRQGRPSPWQATGNFHADDDGVAEIVSLPGSTSASVIVSQRDWEALSGSSSVYNLVRVTDDSMEPVSVSGWPAWQPDPPTSTSLKKRQAQSDFSTVTARSVDESYAETVVGSSDSDARLKTRDGTLVRPPEIIVSDTAGGSRLLNFTPELADLRLIASEKARIRTSGRTCEEEECRPLILLAAF